MLVAATAVLPLRSTPIHQLLLTQNINSSKIIEPTTTSAFLYCCYSHNNNSNKKKKKKKLHSHFKSTFPVNCTQGAAAGDDNLSPNEPSQVNSSEMSSKLAKLGLSAVLAYGLFDAMTYTSFFVFAFLGYEKSTGKNPAANIQALFGIVILMWTGNNITRPFRVAGAAALAPIIDKGLKKIQNYFRFPNLVYAFALVVSIVGFLCLLVVGLLILSRLGKC